MTLLNEINTSADVGSLT